MNLIILAASGRTGRELVRQALERGHTVVAIARDPARIPFPETAFLQKVAGDVQEPDAFADVVDGASVVLSGLGTDRAGLLAAGAKAVIAAGPSRIIWLGAYGTGGSAEAAGEQALMIVKMLGAGGNTLYAVQGIFIP